ncbi:MAG TPA: hypothetical protein VK829_17930 [Terriglobales bacterium]|nr:hypothetical protein [Terriglobales bacterium]
MASHRVGARREDSTRLFMFGKTGHFSTFDWRSETILSFFLFLLVLLGFVFPCLGVEHRNLPLYGDIAFSVLLIVGAMSAWGDRRLFVLASLVVSIAMIVRWANWWAPTNTLTIWSAWTGLAAIIMVTALLLWRVFSPGPVTSMRVQGAVAAYLSLGFGWAHAYHIAAILDPGAFAPTGSNLSAVSSWVNYSFGMLTTLGYQGIAPVHAVAHTLGSGEAVTGQLYLAVLVARLVSQQMSTTQTPRN